MSLVRARRRFDRAAQRCEAAQHERLRLLVRHNAATAYGRAHRFNAVSSVREWQDRVPLVGYEEIAPWVGRVADGEAGVLTAAPVRIFERTTGSTSGPKRVPYTDGLLAEFGAATGPWLHDLYTRVPALRGTTSYWSISPVTRVRERTAGGIPVGFDDDTEYFGGFARRVLRRTLAVPPEVARLADVEAWSAETLRSLAAAGDLGLVSVWHPSFFTLLVRRIEERLDDVLATLPRARAEEIRSRLDVGTVGEALWPRLAVVSCWTEGAAAQAVPALRRCLPHARVQPKGLLATEGVVSFPLVSDDEAPGVAAVAGHFLEFVDLEAPRARPRLAHELHVGAAYSPVLSTAGGFYRYRLGDAVRCEGFHAAVPRLRFLGRVDQVSDLCGEKLDARSVAHALAAAQAESGLQLRFALLVPLPGDPPRYRLYADGVPREAVAALRERVDRRLAENEAYRHARALGQLGPPEVTAVDDGARRYFEACTAAGQRPGDVKPAVLETRIDWRRVFDDAAADPHA